MSKILVTGGAGFIGSHIADYFINKGDKVVVFDNLSSGNIYNVNKRVKFVKGDIRNLEEFEMMFENVDYVFHMAALVSVPLSIENPELNKEVNVDGTKKLLELALKYGVKKVVVASSAAVYGDNPNTPLKEDEVLKPMSPYADAKVEIEKMGKEFSNKGLPVVAFRFFNVYGPRQDPKSPYSGVISIFSHKIKNDENITLFGDGSQTRDFISIFDVLQAVILGLKIEPGNYNVASGKSLTVKEMAEKLIKLCDSKSQIIFKEKREGDIHKSLADISKIKKCGFQITKSFDEGLKELLEEY